MRDIEFLKNNGVDVDKSLELFGDIETYNDTIGEFLVGANEKLPKIKYYKDMKDMANYAILVHSLKSDAKYFGFTKLADLAYQHELKSKENDYYFVYENFDSLMQEANRMVSLVKQYMGQEPVNNNQPVQTTNNVNINAMGEVFSEKTILVADDSNIVRNFVKKIFDNEYKVAAAQDGKEAIDIINANAENDNIVAVLLDLNMPKLDGFAVLENMQSNNLLYKIPVSIISGDSSKETINKAFTYKIVDMIQKPFNESDIKRVVEKTIYFKQMNN